MFATEFEIVIKLYSLQLHCKSILLGKKLLHLTLLVTSYPLMARSAICVYSENRFFLVS